MTDSTAGSPEVRKFGADEAQLLNLVAHSLYSDEDVFLREMISNASDALDKLRYEAINNQDLLEGDAELGIWLEFDKEAKVIRVRDNGIGMNHDEVVDNLGTIARSGTRAFKELLSKKNAKESGSDNSNLIGQFGVGFYSTFVVAKLVEVRTRRAGDDAAAGVLWSSNGESEYEISPLYIPHHGTEITLFLRDDKEDFLSDYKLRDIIHKFSDHVAFPIYMLKAEELGADEKDKPDAPREYEKVNQARALWTKSRSEITAEEYQEFYKHISHDTENALGYSHNKVEGKYEYTSLLYIPKKAPFDLWYQEMHRGLKLYVRRVFIMDEADQFLPLYLRFVRGVIDADSLPLNISRELLQNNNVVETIRSGCVKRVLSMIEKMASDEDDSFTTFWDEFGQVLKEGVGQDYANRDRLAKLLRFSSTYDNNEKQRVSFADYVARMKEGQDKIYYIVADNFNTARNSPLLEMFAKKNIEVILLHDKVDEWLVAHLTNFEGKQLQSISKGDINIGTEEEKAEEKKQVELAQKDFASLVEQLKKDLQDEVKDVRLTQRLTDSPACIVYDEGDMGGHMQRLLKSMGQEAPQEKPILELNPEHPLVVKMNSLTDDAECTKWARLLLQQSQLSESGHMQDPAKFVKQMNDMWVSML
jgi:molecular chaperone HtpG